MSSTTLAIAGLLLLLSLGISTATFAESGDNMAENTKTPLQIVPKHVDQ